MRISKILLSLLSVTFIMAHPILESREAGASIVSRAAKKPAPVKSAPKPAPKSAPKPNQKEAQKKGSAPPGIVMYTGGGVVADARKANNAPGREVPKLCKKLADCSCPKSPEGKTSSTSCINGVCSCNNKAIEFFANKFIDAVAAIGNAPITKAIAGLMKGIATAKQVAGIIAGAVLPPPARAALKIALNAIPDTGPSHIDQASKGILNKVL